MSIFTSVKEEIATFISEVETKVSALEAKVASEEAAIITDAIAVLQGRLATITPNQQAAQSNGTEEDVSSSNQPAL